MTRNENVKSRIKSFLLSLCTSHHPGFYLLCPTLPISPYPHPAFTPNPNFPPVIGSCLVVPGRSWSYMVGTKFFIWPCGHEATIWLKMVAAAKIKLPNSHPGKQMSNKEMEQQTIKQTRSRGQFQITLMPFLAFFWHKIFGIKNANFSKIKTNFQTF